MIHTLIPEQNLDCYKQHELAPRCFYFIMTCDAVSGHYLIDTRFWPIRPYFTYLGVLN